MKQTVHGKDAVKRNDADVVKKGSGRAVPNEQWEYRFNASPVGIPNDSATAFDPMPSKMRPRTYIKTNECDY
jgi:hypothetical protein